MTSKVNGSVIVSASPMHGASSYQSRGQTAFAFADELAGKRQQLADIEQALALDIDGAEEANALAA